MRARLVAIALAATVTVVLAYSLPLAGLVSDSAWDKAVAAAERDAATVAGALAATADRDALSAVLEGTVSGRAGRLTVLFPDGTALGAPAIAGDEVALARLSTEPFGVAAGDDLVWLTPVVTSAGVAVVRVLVPAAQLRAGVDRARAVLVALALGLLIVAAGMASLLARGITRPARALASGAVAVVGGAIETRVEPSGPPELRHVAVAFNHLAGRVAALVGAERQAVAELAHRLRTPVTAVRLDAESVADTEDRRRLIADVDVLSVAVDAVIEEARRPERQTTTPRCDLVDIVQHRVAFWSVLAEEQHRAWQVNVDGGPYLVAVPPADLKASIDALLDNVFSHTPAGTAFRVGVAAAPGGVRLVVADDGPGFGAANGAGTGLGLEIARRAAEAGGGRLEIDSHGGAVITVELPLAP